MGVTFSPGVLKKASKHSRAAAPLSASLDQTWRLRVKHLQTVYSVSHTTLYARIKQGLIPPPDGYDFPNQVKGKQGKPYWNSETIRNHLKNVP